MDEATKFLTARAQALSALTLYKEGHPARERALDTAHNHLWELQEAHLNADFTFLGNEIIFDGRPLRDLKSWDWGARMAAVGVQRVELLGRVERDDFEVFLEDVHARLSGEKMETSEVRQTRPTNIRFGMVVVGKESEEGRGDADQIATATITYTLREEAEAVDWLHRELKTERDLHMVEAEAVVRSLSVAMHGDQAFLIPLLRLKEFDQYTTTHAMNVSVLAMALSEFVGLGPKEVRTFGIAGLLHDLGKVKIPDEILNKPGKLSDEERDIMNAHTVEGARLILSTEEQLDLAAVVAYEHHIKIDGGGYPKMEYPRKCHQASDLVHVCDVFDALRTDRPYRDAWELPRVLSYLEEGAGAEFDPDLAYAFCQMMRRWETRVAELESENQPIPLGQGVGTVDDDSMPPQVGDSWETGAPQAPSPASGEAAQPDTPAPAPPPATETPPEDS
jgi:putative nucleotidyltransferase with HDIG domain